MSLSLVVEGTQSAEVELEVQILDRRWDVKF
jgi:hypothetical protein